MDLLPNARLRDSVSSRLNALLETLDRTSNIYPRLRELEGTISALYHIEAVQIRSFWPDAAVDQLVKLIPTSHFECPFPPFRKACGIWAIPVQRTLFQIGFDYNKRGAPFFYALYRLAQADPDWSRCLDSLRKAALARRSQPGILTRDKASQRYRKAISLHDVEIVLEQYPNRPKSRQGTQLDDDFNRPRELSAEPQQQGTPQPRTPTPDDLGPPEPQTPGHPSVTTPEVGRTVVRTKTRSPLATRSRASRDRAAFVSSSPTPATEGGFDPFSSPSPAQTQSGLFIAEPHNQNFFLEEEDSDTENDQFLVDDIVEESQHTIHVGASSCQDNISPSKQESATEVENCNESQDHSSSQSPLCSGHCGSSRVLPPSKMAEPSAKRPCHGSFCRRIPEADAAQLLQDGKSVGVQLLSNAMAVVCELDENIVVVDPAEFNRLAMEGSQPDPTLVDIIFVRETIFLPMQVGEEDVALAIVRHSARVAVSVQLYGPFQESDGLTVARKIVDLFVSKYLPKTGRRARLSTLYPDICSRGDANHAIYMFAFAAFKATGHDAPAVQHPGLWRKIMLGCLGVKIQEWEVSAPAPDMPDPEAIMPFHMPEGVDEIQQIRLLREQYTRRREAALRRLESDFARIESSHHSVYPARCVLETLCAAAAAYIERVETRLDEAKERDSYRAGSGGSQPSAVLLSQQHEAARALHKDIKAILDGVKGLDERLDGVFETWLQRRESVLNP